MSGQGAVFVLALLLPIACAAPPAVEAPPRAAGSVDPPSSLVYRAILDAPPFFENIQDLCPDGRPWVCADLMRDPEALGFRWNVDYFEPWLDMVRHAPPPEAGATTWDMPDDVLRDCPGKGSAGLRFSRVGFSPDGQEATVAWQVARLGVFVWGGMCCLDRTAGGWTITCIDNTWALTD